MRKEKQNPNNLEKSHVFSQTHRISSLFGLFHFLSQPSASIINVDLLKCDRARDNYTSFIGTNGFAIINKIHTNYATRMGKTATLIDKWLTNNMRFKYTISIVDTELSDHKMILLALCDTKGRTINYSHEIVSSKFVTINQNHYTRQLSVVINECTNNISNLIDIFNRIKYNTTKTRTFSHKSNINKPWMNDQLLKVIDERDRYAKLMKKINK